MQLKTWAIQSLKKMIAMIKLGADQDLVNQMIVKSKEGAIDQNHQKLENDQNHLED